MSGKKKPNALFIEKEDIWEHNYENLHSFIELHDNRMENVFKD